MRHTVLPLVFALLSMLATSGCVTPRRARVAAVPPAPQAAPAAPPEEMPISIVQNAAALPPDQPVPPEALPPLDPPEQTAPRSQPTDAAEAARRRNAARKPPETAAPVPAPAATQPAAPAAQQPAPLVASDQNLPARSALAAKINDLKITAGRIAQPGLTGSQRTTYRRIESFIKLSERALLRGDLRQADELADRAATLARALNRDN
jgi:hypothetical protein